ncbi:MULTISPECIES: hypothetical protein [unclassified Ruegeria]|uniref:hypothetical protein n=1 Tax=unclassified Ruegeria TaxID=2625375 RepID=UPI00147F9827|nr:MULTISPECIES: hypothetical protein [unclassified Ruegeria]
MDAGSRAAGRERRLAALRRYNESGRGSVAPFGSGNHKRCNATRMDGQPCRGWAAFRTPKCIKHGARGLAGKPSPNREVRAARNWLMENRPSRELVNTPEWRATDTLGTRNGILRKAALVAAWEAAQQGDWRLWRMLQQNPLPQKIWAQPDDNG